MPQLRKSLLLCITLILSLVIASDAKVFDSPHQVSHNRFLKKRASAPQLFGVPGQPVNGAGANPSTPSGIETSQSASTETTAAETPTSPASSASSSSSIPSTSGGLLGSVVGGPTTTTSVSSSSSTSSTTSASTLSSSSIAEHSEVTPSTTATPTQVASAASQTVVVITNTSSASASATPSSLSSSSTGITHTALIILIVVAASVGGSIIIWTIIRKWKFGKSSNFDDRMQPIDWQPSTDDDGAIPGMNRRHSNASSFQSGSGHGHGGPGTKVLDPIPDHDFTAGPASFAPVGGYADLARGPSPQPMMHELARGPSFSRQYQSDQYGVPLHHGGYGTGY